MHFSLFGKMSLFLGLCWRPRLLRGGRLLGPRRGVCREEGLRPPAMQQGLQLSAGRVQLGVGEGLRRGKEGQRVHK